MTLIRSHERKRSTSILFCGSNMPNRTFITKTTSGKLGFRHRKSTRDDLLLTDVGVRFLSNGKIEGVVWRDQTTAAKETTVSVAPMHFISTWKYLGNRDSRSCNICVSSDKLGCFLSFCDIFVFWKLCYVSDKNENIKCTNCPTSTHPAKNITLACWACLCFWLEKSAGKSNCIRPEMKIQLSLPER